MRTYTNGLGACALVALLAGCTSGQSAVEPPANTPPLNDTLKFAVGTANINGVTGLNTVVTFRQNNTGLSATLLNTPKITGPAGFVVPSVSSAGIDGGTNTISAAAQTPANQPAPPTATFGQTVGAFAYGFQGLNSATSGAANYPKILGDVAPNNLPTATSGLGVGMDFVTSMPFYASTASKLPYIGGPPAYPFFNDGTFPSGFLGYPAGFTDFTGVTLATGTYSLSVLVPAANAASQTFTATATLNSLTPLPTFPKPTFTSDGAGGGTIVVNVPAGVTETLVYVCDINPAPSGYPFAGKFFTLLTTGTGTQTLTLPPSIGFKTGSTAGPSIASGDAYYVYAVGFDYPAFEAGPPGNVTASPTITGANGQADITTSGVTAGTY